MRNYSIIFGQCSVLKSQIWQLSRDAHKPTREQERLAYEERLTWMERKSEAEIALLYQDPQVR